LYSNSNYYKLDLMTQKLLLALWTCDRAAESQTNAGSLL
jgi:hypothetical protein